MMFLLNDYWMTFCATRVIRESFPFPSLCSHAGAGILLVSNTGTITSCFQRWFWSVTRGQCYAITVRQHGNHGFSSQTTSCCYFISVELLCGGRSSQTIAGRATWIISKYPQLLIYKVLIDTFAQAVAQIEFHFCSFKFLLCLLRLLGSLIRQASFLSWRPTALHC